jgi:hypothetical protein
VQQATKNRIFDLVAPLILGLGFLVKIILNILFGWWLFPLLQWKNSRAFMKEVKLKWGSLLSRTSSMTVAAGDSPTITIAQDNLLFTLVRWHDETAIRVAPRHVPAESYEVGLLIAAIEQRHYSEHDIVNDLEGAEKMLLPRLDALNAAFSEQRYSRIREKL